MSILGGGLIGLGGGTGGGGSSSGSGNPVDARAVEGAIVPDASGVYPLGALNKPFSHIFANSGVFMNPSDMAPVSITPILHVIADNSFTDNFPILVDADYTSLYPGIRVNSANGRGFGFFGGPNNNQVAQELYNDNLGYTDNLLVLRTTRAQSSDFHLIRGDNINGGQIVFTVRGDGQIASDVAGVTNPADYAEYFESLDPQGIPAGLAVEIVDDTDGKIRLATDADEVIGFTSADPAYVADGAWNSWVGKFERDDLGSRILNASGEPRISQSYDPRQEYIPRERRDEWVAVGLVGKIYVKCSETITSSWVTLGPSGMVKNWTDESVRWKLLERKRAFNPARGDGVVRILVR